VDGLTVLREARRAGLAVTEDDGRLVVRGPCRLEPVARELLAHKAGVLDALAAERTALDPRMAAMLAQIPPAGAIPLLLARPDWPARPGACCSCGEPLAQAERYRCRPCVDAAVRVLESRP
jgi:hypothetical protein